jgi:hypothetical protein
MDCAGSIPIQTLLAKWNGGNREPTLTIAEAGDVVTHPAQCGNLVPQAEIRGSVVRLKTE